LERGEKLERGLASPLVSALPFSTHPSSSPKERAAPENGTSLRYLKGILRGGSALFLFSSPSPFREKPYYAKAS
jgi:hypothetical protein